MFPSSRATDSVVVVSRGFRLTIGMGGPSLVYSFATFVERCTDDEEDAG